MKNILIEFFNFFRAPTTAARTTAPNVVVTKEEDGYAYTTPKVPFVETTPKKTPPPVVNTKKPAAITKPHATTQPPTYLPPVEECGPDSLDLKCCGKGSKNPACNPTTPRPTTPKPTTPRPTTTQRPTTRPTTAAR